MKPIKTFKIGSIVFFSNYPDYKVKDVDYIAIMDSFFPGKTIMKVQIGTDDIFMFKPNVKKEDFINDLLENDVPMKAGKFLVPEFVKYFNFTIDDLKNIGHYFDAMDDKHAYEKIIYDSYIENNDFILTDVQRDKAYEEYKKSRDL